MTATSLAATQQLHGWLYDPAHKEYRYTGVFYPVQDGQYALTYTTEEDISRFRQGIISREAHPEPAAPTEILVGGTLAEEPIVVEE